MHDPDTLVEDLVCQCLQAREHGDPVAIDRLLATQPPDIREQVTAMLGTLDRVGLTGEAAPNPSEGHALQFGPYLLLERLGAGAMGVVYRARDPGGTERALKLLQPGLLPVRRARLRFDREIRALRELDHPGICPILDAGEVDGVPFLVMPLLTGISLREQFAAGPARDETARRRLLTVIEQIAEALHHAHERGFVHRDVKPANILLAGSDRPVVLDFGLARLDRDDAASLSLSHEVIGAPAYMAPEQISDGRCVDRRADVYALGVLLYEGLTGRCPYEAATRESLYRRILTGDAEPPSRRIADVPAPLDVVCLTALARYADGRYQTAAAFAADLARVRAGQRPHAQLPGPLARARHWIRGNPLASTLVALLVVAVVAVSWQTLRERRASARDRARLLAAEALDVLPADPSRAEQLGLQAHAMAPDVPESLIAIEAARSAECEEFVLAGHSRPVTDVGFSSDSTRLASASLDGTARLWTLRTGSFVELRHGGDGVAMVRLQPGGDLAITASCTDARVCAWDATTGERRWERAANDAGSPVRVMLWSPDGRWLLTGSAGGARLWSPDGSFRELVTTATVVSAGAWLGNDVVALGTAAPAQVPTTEPPWLRTFHLDATPASPPTVVEDGVVSLHMRPGFADCALVVGGAGRAYLWNCPSGTLTKLDSPQESGVHAAGWTANGDTGLTIAPGGVLAFWNPDGSRQRASGVQTVSLATGFLPHPRKEYAAVSGGMGVVQLRSLQGAGTVFLGRRRLRVLPIAFSANGDLLATCGWDHSVRVWATWRERQPRFFVGDTVLSAVWAADGRRIVTGSNRGWANPGGGAGVLRTWDTTTGAMLDCWAVRGAVSRLMTDTDQDRMLAVCSRWDFGCIREVATMSGELLRDGAVPDPFVRAGTLLDGWVLPHGRMAAVGEKEGLLIADLGSGALVQRLPVVAPTAGTTGDGYVLTMGATADGATIWVGGTSGFLHRFDLGQDGQYSETRADQVGELIRSIRWIDDGSLLLGLANGILQRRLPDGTVIAFAGHRDDVTYVDWARVRGQLLVASGDYVGGVRLWRGDGTLLRVIQAHAGPVWSVRFSPQGDRVLTASADGNARIWPVVLDVGR